ncbi:MAG TPA: ribonuclease D [Gemmatimonadaceae bacterium]|nr:ribonuclease D [Gemmatimonadaceae bacterium]
MKTDGTSDGRPHQAEYLDTPAAVARWTSSIGEPKLVALDTEGASFHRFVDRIYLLQVSTRERTAVIDPIPIGVPKELGALVENPAVEIVFHDADYDLRLLQQDYGWQIRNVFDTRVAAQLLGIRAFGLAALLERFFGVKLDKKHQRADWSMRPLTADMLDYAALDTMYLPDLRDRLKEALEKAGRWSWAREEFTRLEATRWSVEDETTAFMKMKGARDLNRRELAVLRELVGWRNAAAAEQDRATFRILGNEPLFEIAKTQPRDRAALSQIKGMPRGVLESRATALLAAVERGLAVADADLPRFPRGPRWDRDPEFDARVSALKTVRDAIAERLDMDTGVLCSRDRMEAVARAKPSTLEDFDRIPELRRWQVEVLAPGFLDALRHHQSSSAPAPAAPAPAVVEDRSPYRE